MKLKLKIPFSKNQYFRFSFIGVLSIFVFLFLANIFVGTDPYFDNIFTISIIIILWLGCSVITYLIDKIYSWNESAIKRLIIEIPSVLVFSVCIYILFEYVPKKIHNEEVVWQQLKTGATVTGIISILVVAIGESSDILKAWKSSILKNKELEKENIEAQFFTLKSQVNPHFLFNSLNTLANYVQDNVLATNYLQNLSEYLRFILVLNEDKLVPVKKELSIIKRYTFLQKSRFKEGIELIQEIDDAVIQNNGCVPPFSLQILIENAIKHNIVSKSRPLHIKIYTENNDRIVVLNNIQAKEVQYSTQIGLRNITERYSLISNKKVIIENTGKYFLVSLPILYNSDIKQE